jgi:hypothetical protein
VTRPLRIVGMFLALPFLFIFCLLAEPVGWVFDKFIDFARIR